MFTFNSRYDCPGYGQLRTALRTKSSTVHSRVTLLILNGTHVLTNGIGSSCQYIFQTSGGELILDLMFGCLPVR